MKSGNLNFLEPSGPLQACNGTALPFIYIIYYMCYIYIYLLPPWACVACPRVNFTFTFTFISTFTFICTMWIKMDIQKFRARYKILYLNNIICKYEKNTNKDLASSRWTGTNRRLAVLRVEPKLCLAIYRRVTVLLQDRG